MKEAFEIVHLKSIEGGKGVIETVNKIEDQRKTGKT